MKRGAIYITGVMGVVFLAALVLPETGRTIEARLQSEMDFALSDKGLNDIQAHIDGQTVTFIYAPDTDNPAPRTLRLAAQHMTLALFSAETLTGGLYSDRGGYGPVWGPVTQTHIAPSSLNPSADVDKPAS